MTGLFLSDIKHTSMERAVSKNTKLLIDLSDDFTGANEAGDATRALRNHRKTVSTVLSAATLPG